MIKPYYQDSQITEYHGHTPDVLKELPAESVHIVVTSVPYWGLRDYGLEPQVWDDAGGCPHLWGHERKVKNSPPRDHNGANAFADTRGTENQRKNTTLEASQGSFCKFCNAWRGSLGLEPIPELYIQHIVQVFREVRRALRKDGTCWLNIGDSYASGKGSCFNPGGGENSLEGHAKLKEARAYKLNRPNISDLEGMGLKPKDLCMIPARVALALQADGWWLRSMMPWVKRSAMPESCTDRPASALEYVILLSKSKDYYFDMDAVRVGQKDTHLVSENYGQLSESNTFSSKEGNKSVKYGTKWQPKKREYNPTGRNLRNTDLFFESIQPPHGMVFAGDEPVGLDINPESLKEAHFASFPSRLCEIAIKAGTSERGCCPECGAPWVRVVEKEKHGRWDHGIGNNADPTKVHKKRTETMGDSFYETYKQPKTIGWRRTCLCRPSDPEEGEAWSHPCTVLDPFSGSGRALIVAKNLGRKAIGIDLKVEYLKMPLKKLAQERLI